MLSVAAHAATESLIARRKRNTLARVQVPRLMPARKRMGVSPLSVTVPVFDLEAVQRAAAK